MKVLLGVTGGIAAYKSLELTRLFVKAGDEVQVVMTEGAKAFIQPLSFQALSGNPVRDRLFDAHQEAGMGHIELARWADVIVIAPCSAETLAKLRMGRADNLLTTLCLATDRPILIAPAMNRLMWQNAATQENVQRLRDRDVEIMEPDAGEQACGETGKGRMPQPESILSQVQKRYQTHQTSKMTPPYSEKEVADFWQGKKLLITAGPTHEAIDPVRFIGNRSSGKMGYAIAEQAARLGAEVTLVSGPVSLETDLKTIQVTSALQMFEAVKHHYAEANVFISTAAVADFRVDEPSEQKIKKQADSESMTLALVKNPDIVAWVAQQSPKPFVVGFAAETENLECYAKEKLKRKNLDLIAANLVGDTKGFEADDNALQLITAEQSFSLSRSSKLDQAQSLLVYIAQISS